MEKVLRWGGKGREQSGWLSHQYISTFGSFKIPLAIVDIRLRPLDILGSRVAMQMEGRVVTDEARLYWRVVPLSLSLFWTDFLIEWERKWCLSLSSFVYSILLRYLHAHRIRSHQRHLSREEWEDVLPDMLSMLRWDRNQRGSGVR